MSRIGSSNTKSVVKSQGFPAVYIAGMVFAGYCSHTLGNTIGWVAMHTVFSWWYLLYLCGGCGGGFPAGTF